MWNGVQSCKKAAAVNPATQRRLLKDLKNLLAEPIPLAAAQPCSDQDLTLWDGVVGVEMEVTHIGSVTVPLHFLIDFPGDYPQSAPNIGFSFEFQYRGGAEYIMPDGRLKGKKVVCLDVLGNFQSYHTEWKDTVGSGWSPAYTVTTLLVQLQSVLCDLGSNMSQRERDVTYLCRAILRKEPNCSPRALGRRRDQGTPHEVPLGRTGCQDLWRGRDTGKARGSVCREGRPNGRWGTIRNFSVIAVRSCLGAWEHSAGKFIWCK
jgi:ubiquitin-protein ligase